MKLIKPRKLKSCLLGMNRVKVSLYNWKCACSCTNKNKFILKLNVELCLCHSRSPSASPSHRSSSAIYIASVLMLYYRPPNAASGLSPPFHTSLNIGGRCSGSVTLQCACPQSYPTRVPALSARRRSRRGDVQEDV